MERGFIAQRRNAGDGNLQDTKYEHDQRSLVRTRPSSFTGVCPATDLLARAAFRNSTPAEVCTVPGSNTIRCAAVRFRRDIEKSPCSNPETAWAARLSFRPRSDQSFLISLQDGKDPAFPISPFGAPPHCRPAV